MVKITIDNAMGQIEGLPNHILIGIENACSFDVKGAEKSELYKKGRWDGRKKLFDKKTGKYAMGLHMRIMEIIANHNIEYELIDNTTGATEGYIRGVCLSESMQTRDYQLEAVERAIEGKRSILQVATGGGKTVIASLLINRLKCRTLFLVHTKDLLYQAIGSFEQMLEGVEIGQMGDGVINIKDITVATIQTLSKYLKVKYVVSQDKESEKDAYSKDKVKMVKEFVDSVDLLIFDEVHRIACDSAYNVSNAIKSAPYRVGLSGSPWRDDGADLMIEGAMGQVSYKVPASFLIDNDYLVPPIINFVRIPASIHPDADTRTYDQIYRDEIVNNDYRNNKILKYASDFMEMNIPSLILVQQINHGKILKKLISDQYHPVDFLSGKDFTEKRLQTIEEMREGKRISLIASVIADEGLDIKRLAGVIIAGGGKSTTRALQRVGRVLRPFEGKTHALVVDFLDESKYLYDHSIKRRNLYLTEPRFTIMEL